MTSIAQPSTHVVELHDPTPPDPTSLGVNPSGVDPVNVIKGRGGSGASYRSGSLEIKINTHPESDEGEGDRDNSYLLSGPPSFKPLCGARESFENGDSTPPRVITVSQPPSDLTFRSPLHGNDQEEESQTTTEIRTQSVSRRHIGRDNCSCYISGCFGFSGAVFGIAGLILLLSANPIFFPVGIVALVCLAAMFIFPIVAWCVN